MAQSKSQKKFEQRHLKDTLERRNGLKKIKQKQQLKAKKKARRNEEEGRAPDENAAPTHKSGKKAGEETFKDMSVDDFFQGGFDIPDMPAQKKRKRQPAKEEDMDEESASESSMAEEPVTAGADESDESEDEETEDHQAQLAALAEKDPDFHKYLQENEPELLQGDLAQLGDLSDADDDDEIEDAGPKRKKQRKGQVDAEESDEELAGGGKNELDSATVKKWQKALTEEHSMRAAKEVVLAFRSAAHVSENDDDGTFKYSISDPEVYHQLLTTALKHIPTVLQHHLPVQETKNGKVRVETESKKFKTLAPVLKSHVSSIIHLLSNLTDPGTLRLTLGSTLPLLPYLLSFKKLVRDVGRAAANTWSSSSTTEATRIAAFLVLRRLVVIGDNGIRENILKATYQGLVKGSRNTTLHTLPGVNLMKNSAAELWGLASTDVAYTTAFTFIRQLAIHLRSAITQSSKAPTKDKARATKPGDSGREGWKLVYNWQYTHSLDFWSRTLSAHARDPTAPLRPLIYPLVQVTLGAARCVPTATYFPLRFHLLRALLRLSRATTTYIPLAPALHEVLASAEMKKAPKASTLKPLDFATTLRAPKSYLRTRTYQDGVGEQVLELLSEFFVLWARNIAFPELALPVVIQLKRWAKEASSRAPGQGNKNQKVNQGVQLLVQKLEAQGRWIEERRGKVEFAPGNRTGVEGFLAGVEWERSPLGAFVVGQRKGREERARVVEEGRVVEERKREGERRARREERETGVGMEEGAFSEEGSGSEGESGESDEEEGDVGVDGEGSELEGLSGEEEESD